MKRVSFDSNVQILNYGLLWSFAYHDARKSDWESAYLDRCRFELRKKSMKEMLAEIGFFSRQK